LKINPFQWLLKNILAVQTHYPLLTFLVALAMAALSILYTARSMTFQTGQRDLIYPSNRLMQLSVEISQFDDLDSFVVAIENREARRSLKFLRALVARLEADPEHFLQVFYRVDPKQFRPWALLYLDKKDLLTLGDNLREHRLFIEEMVKSPTLVNFFGQINREMASKMVEELFTGFLEESSEGKPKKPFDLDFLIRVLEELNGFLDGEGQFSSPWESLLVKEGRGKESEEGYFWTKDKRYLLLFIKPGKEAGSFAAAVASLTVLRKTITQVQADFPGIEAGVTGQEALNADQMNTSLHDMSLATLLSVGGLTILLILFWRRFRRPLLEMTRLLIDLCLTFGLTTLVIGHLNILSVTFAPLLLGLGVDYGVHWFARYMEEERKGFTSKKEVLQVIMDRLGPGILLAGLSASLSFFPLVLTGFKGLVELGIICAMGLVITSMTALTLLPALILLFDKPRPKSYSTPASARIEPFFELTRWRVLAVLILGGAGFAFALWGAGKIRFDLNLLQLQSPEEESVVWGKKLMEESGFSSRYAKIIAHSLEEVRQKTKGLENLPTVSKVESVDNLLPHDQEEKIEILRRLKPVSEGIGPFRRANNGVNLQELETVLSRIRFKMLDSSSSQWGVNKPLEVQMMEVRSLIDQLRQQIRARGPKAEKALANFQSDLIQDLDDKLDILRTNLQTRVMRLEDLPENLLKRFVSDQQTYLLRVYPKEDIWEPQILGRFVDDLRSVDTDAVGEPVTLWVFTRAFRDACIKAALYAVTFIFIFLLLTFRDLKTTLLALVPLLIGTAWTLGLMHLFKVDLNLANSLFLPLVVGAAVEYAIIILHRWRQREKDKEGVILPFSTAMGVILAGLTTTVGFGSLMISNHQGIYSLGLLATIGSLSILAAAVLFLPALLQFSSTLTALGRGKT
jgi:uncharacterized protein